jgi:hypothetical protein
MTTIEQARAAYAIILKRNTYVNTLYKTFDLDVPEIGTIENIPKRNNRNDKKYQGPGLFDTEQGAGKAI